VTDAGAKIARRRQDGERLARIGATSPVIAAACTGRLPSGDSIVGAHNLLAADFCLCSRPLSRIASGDERNPNPPSGRGIKSGAIVCRDAGLAGRRARHRPPIDEFEDLFLLAVPASDSRIEGRGPRVADVDIDQSRLILPEDGHCLRASGGWPFCANARPQPQRRGGRHPCSAPAVLKNRDADGRGAAMAVT